VAIEHAVEQIERAQIHYKFIQQTNESLPEAYAVSLQELEAEIQGFDSVYEVTEAELENAKSVAKRTNFLAAVTDAYRTYHETIVDLRVGIAREWFDSLEAAINEESVSVAVGLPELAKQGEVLQKLTDAGKYGRLLESERVGLDEFEDGVRDLDTATRETLDPGTYVDIGVELVESFHERYTQDLTTLVEEGVDRSVISVADRVQDAPETDPIMERAERGEATKDDTETMGEAVRIYANVARVTGRHRAKYDLGTALVSAIEEPSFATDDVASELREHLTTLDIDSIESRVTTELESEVITSDADRFVQLLSKHDGSVRRTGEVIDVSTDEMFDRLQDLYETGELADLEAHFE
jgi:hypothetical protein